MSLSRLLVDMKIQRSLTSGNAGRLYSEVFFVVFWIEVRVGLPNLIYEFS